MRASRGPGAVSSLIFALLLPICAAGNEIAAAPPVAAPPAVDLKNDASESVSVPAGTDNGVTAESDFAVTAGDNVTVYIYPAEIYRDRFWSQPLPSAVYARIGPGTPVKPATLSKVAHAMVRAEGEKRLVELKERKEEARRQAARRKVQELKDKRNDIIERRDLVEERLAAAERTLADEEGRMEVVANSADDDIDRASQRIAELADRRDELQSQRSAMAQQPRPAGNDPGRINSEIKLVSGQINTEREKIRIARDRKRQAREAYITRKTDWQKLVADRNDLVNRIKSMDLQIRELQAR